MSLLTTCYHLIFSFRHQANPLCDRLSDLVTGCLLVIDTVMLLETKIELNYISNGEALLKSLQCFAVSHISTLLVLSLTIPAKCL